MMIYSIEATLNETSEGIVYTSMGDKQISRQVYNLQIVLLIINKSFKL